MPTEKDYNEIADWVYLVDSKKTDEPLKGGQSIINGQYQTLKTEDNTDNGMQAMAVAPVDKNGLPDYSQFLGGTLCYTMR